MKAFQNNGKNISENIVKLKLEKNIEFLPCNHLVYITYVQRKQIFDNFVINLPDTTENHFDTGHS